MNVARTKEPTIPGEQTMPDRALQDAFALMQNELLGTLYHLVGNIEDAKDALQETFMKCWRHRAKVAEVDNLKAWIFQIALNTGRDLRSTAWRRRRQPLGESEGMLSAPATDPQAELERREQLSRLRTAIGELRPEEQEVFLLRQNGDLTYEQIAETAGIPVGTVKTRMRLALTKLRAVLGVGTPVTS